MKFQYASGLSHQAISLYRLLLLKGPLTAKEIGAALDIYPHSVYRVASDSEQKGLIKQIGKYPAKYLAKPVNEARENYLAEQRSRFDRLVSDFSLNKQRSYNQDEEFNIQFIQGREEVFTTVANDLTSCKRLAHFIVLGLPIGISPEVLYQQKMAAERGIDLKIISQEYNNENREMLSIWAKQGAQVRHGKPLGFHLLLFDDRISYIMAYDAQDKTKRYAVRITHLFINKELQPIFNRCWKKAEDI